LLDLSTGLCPRALCKLKSNMWQILLLAKNLKVQGIAFIFFFWIFNNFFYAHSSLILYIAQNWLNMFPNVVIQDSSELYLSHLSHLSFKPIRFLIEYHGFSNLNLLRILRKANGRGFSYMEEMPHGFLWNIADIRLAQHVHTMGRISRSKRREANSFNAPTHGHFSNKSE